MSGRVGSGVKLVLMGAPGAGKGTQGELLAKHFDAERYSTGDMLREAQRTGTTLGRQAQGYMDAGALVPDEVILGIVREALETLPPDKSVILDGFPRTIPQAEGLKAILSVLGQRLDAVIDLQVPVEELVSRLSSRRVCSACGALAGLDNGKPIATCRKCSGKLIQRRDDKPETIRRRLRVYREETSPVLEWYRASPTPLVEVDGSGSVEEVARRLRDSITDR